METDLTHYVLIVKKGSTVKPISVDSIYVYIYIRVYMYIYIYIYIHTRIYTYTHTHIYTYTHTHTHIYKQEVQYKRACEETDIQTRYILLMLASYMAWYVCM